MTNALPNAETGAENRILSEVATGQIITISSPPDAADPSFEEHDWANTNVRGEFLVALAQAVPSPNGIAIVGVRVCGAFDLGWLNISAPLSLVRSLFERQVNLDGAALGNVTLNGSSFPGLSARWAQIELLEAVKSRCKGPLLLSPLHVGHLRLGGANISVDNGVAIDANVLTSDRSVELNNHAQVLGRVRFIGASIGGQLNFRNSIFRTHHENAVTLHEASVARTLYLRDATFYGSVTLAGGSIGGRLDGRYARYCGGPLAIDMNGCTIKRSVQLDGAYSEGEIRMVGARIGSYVRAQRHASLKAPTTAAIAEYGEDDTLQRLSGFAILIERSSIGLDIELSGGSNVEGLAVRQTDVGRSLRLEGMTMLSSEKGVALDLTATEVGGSLILHQSVDSKGTIDVSHAMARRLDDILPWRCEEVVLDGFAYRTVTGEDPKQNLRARIAWLKSQRTFSVQPYEQLAAVYREAGYPDEARNVLWQRDVTLRKEGRISGISRLASLLFGATVGHGYRVHRALVWMTAIWFAGGLIYGAAWNDGDVDLAGRNPNEPQVHCPAGNPCFSPWLLSLDLVVPVIDVGHRASWVPRRGLAQGWAASQTAAGWALTTAAVAGYVRKLQRQ